MASLTITDLDDAILEQWRLRAARNGRSLEDEVRQLLATNDAPGVDASAIRFDRDVALAAAAALRALVMQANGGRMPDDGVDRFIADKRAEVAAEEAKFATSLADTARLRKP
jgi:plasmid stability protein